MKTYRRCCPVARALLRELISGSRHFKRIERGLPGISSSLPARRLRLLERGGVFAL